MATIIAIGAVPGLIAGALAIRNNQPIGGAKKGWHVVGYEPDNLSAQGSIVPLLIGRRRLGCVVAGSWGRYVQNITTTVNGKGRKKRKSTGQQVFFERAWHLICVGPAFRLHGIYQGGRPLYVPETPIDSSTTPSGSTITATDGSGDYGRIYWGESDQPIDDELKVHIKDQNGTPIQSRWPFFCHFVWGSKRLGPTPKWDQIEYDIEVLPQGQLLCGSWFDIIGEGGYKPTNGYNHVEALAQLLFCEFPHGLGLTPPVIGE
ncbi:MAG: hypothetical protein LC123_02400 [Burkholderiales bacterium]|nr:hypothetical protein [Burkholderiales bacterium]